MANNTSTVPDLDLEALREAALKLAPAQIHVLATALASSVGYDLTPEPEHPDSPHARIPRDDLGLMKAVAKAALEVGDPGLHRIDDLKVFLITFDPPTVLALIARIEALQSPTTPSRPDLDEMEKVARAATGGPWQSEHDFDDWGRDQIIGNIDLDGDGQPRGTDICTVDEGPQQADNRAYLNTFHPSAVLSLIAEVRRLEGERESLEARNEDYRVAYVDRHDRATDAEAQVTALTERLERAEGALKPFAEAAESVESSWVDNASMWESSAAMAVTAGDFRRAASALQGED